MEKRRDLLSERLEHLGYRQTLSLESVPLVDRLLADLLQTTESLQKYINVAKKAVQERDNLLIEVDSLKTTNCKLVKECDDSHIAFAKYRERHEKLHKELKNKVTELESQNALWNFDKEKLKKQLRELRFEVAQKSDRIFDLESKIDAGSKSTKSVSTSALKPCKPPWKAGSGEYTSAMAIASQKCAALNKELKKLQEDHTRLVEINESLKKQLNARDRELDRLTALMKDDIDEKKPFPRKDLFCICKETENKVHTLQEELNAVRGEKNLLEERLKEAVEKQHEAMKRALHLSECNKQLENELRDIDQMALAIEAESNQTTRMNAEKLSRLQENLHQSNLQIQTLEKELAEVKRQKQELQGDFNAVHLEKKHLQSVLETALEEKKRLADQINQFCIIENDLNKEIDRLVQSSVAQKQKIAELECALLEQKVVCCSRVNLRTGKKLSKDMELEETVKSKKTSQTKKSRDASSKKTFKSKDQVVEPRNCQSCCAHCGISDPCTSSIKEYIDKEIALRESAMSKEHIQGLESERDFYLKEYNNLVEQMKNLPSKLDDETALLQKLNEKEQELAKIKAEMEQIIKQREDCICTLQEQNRQLSHEKYDLMSRLGTARDRPDTDMESLSLRSVIKRLERDKELLRNDLQTVEEERDEIKRKFKMLNETYTSEKSCLERALADSEERVKSLEIDVQQLTIRENSKSSAMIEMENQCLCLRKKVKEVQDEVSHVRTIYNQLKILHEQTDKALADSQSRILELETELAKAVDKSKILDKNRAVEEEEISKLKNDLMVMRSNLSKLDKEKDELMMALDDKTEKLAKLEKELKSKDEKLFQDNKTITELRKQLSTLQENYAGKEYMLKNLSAEIHNTKEQLDSTLRIKDNALQENKRLQDELANCVAEYRRTNNELEVARRQIEDLKTQLQHYIAEIKRTEDLITQKELERNELLDQFRSLSHEATALENNNHTLESEATQNKVQLSVALEHAMDLEQKLQSQDAMVKNYEKQIADMTMTIACLESQVRHLMTECKCAREELDQLKDLCLKLDREKEEAKRKLGQGEMSKSEIEEEIVKLKENEKTLKEQLKADMSRIDELQRLLQENKNLAEEHMEINEKLKSEVNKLKNQVVGMQSKIIETTQQLDAYQEKALEYSQQNKQLRREIANERFSKMHQIEGKPQVTPNPSDQSQYHELQVPNATLCNQPLTDLQTTNKPFRIYESQLLKSAILKKSSGLNREDYFCNDPKCLYFESKEEVRSIAELPSCTSPKNSIDTSFTNGMSTICECSPRYTMSTIWTTTSITQSNTEGTNKKYSETYETKSPFTYYSSGLKNTSRFPSSSYRLSKSDQAATSTSQCPSKVNICCSCDDVVVTTSSLRASKAYDSRYCPKLRGGTTSVWCLNTTSSVMLSGKRCDNSGVTLEDNDADESEVNGDGIRVTIKEKEFEGDSLCKTGSTTVVPDGLKSENRSPKDVKGEDDAKKVPDKMKTRSLGIGTTMYCEGKKMHIHNTVRRRKAVVATTTTV